jgi:hypothetical protein
MARRSPETHRGFKTGAVASAATPKVCPVCGETPAVAKGEKRHQVLEAHLEQHKPGTPCAREHRRDAAPAWRLDFDAIVRGNPNIWFCSECGFFAPVG